MSSGNLNNISYNGVTFSSTPHATVEYDPYEGQYGSVTFTNDDGESRTLDISNILDIMERIDKIEEMLSILKKPSEEILQKHDGLRAAYEKYKVLEKLII